MESLLMKLLGWTLDLQIQWKKASTKDVYLWIYQNFQSFYRKVLHEPNLFDKIQGSVLQGCSFIKTLLHYRLFSQKKTLFIFFKQLVFGTFPEQNLRWIFFVAKLQSGNCMFITLLKETPPQKFPWEFPKHLQPVIFLICGEEVNYMKDYTKARR